MSKLFFLIFFFVLHSQAGRIRREEDIFDFEVCPESHPFAFSRGQKCCTKPNFEEKEFWISDACKEDATSCPATKCENLKEYCSGHLSVNGESDHSGLYIKIEYSEGNRPIYKEDKSDSCIWWHKFYRHWWIGTCENVGTNSGYAYLQEDGSCPSIPYPNNATWRSGGTDEIIDGLKVSGNLLFPQTVGSGPPPSFSGTAGVNVIIREGKYKQSCRFVFRNGQFRCEEI
jgi:hypothetical protein